MKNWPQIKLGDVTELLTDYHSNGSYELLKKNVELLDTTNYAIMIRTTNFEKKDFKKDLKYITQNAYEFMKKSKVYPGDILMNKIANAGSVYYMPDLKYPVSLAMNLFLIRTNKEKTCQKYIYNYLKFNENYIKTYAIGTAATTITKDAVRNLTVYLPQLPIQKKIAAILSTYDDLIENNNRRISILEKMAEELYREWFVRLRFPEHEKVKIVKGIPEGWELNTIGELYNTSSGGTPLRAKTEYYKDGTLNWLKTGELLDNFIFETEEKITNDALKNSSAKLFPKNTVIIAMYGATIGQLGILKCESSTNQACCALLEKFDDFSFEYIFLFLKSYRPSLISLGMGAAQQNINQDQIRKFPILKPNSIILRRFNLIVSPLFQKIEILQKKNENLKSTRDKLLSRLMSGKIDVENLDIKFPASMQENESD